MKTNKQKTQRFQIWGEDQKIKENLSSSNEATIAIDKWHLLEQKWSQIKGIGGGAMEK